MRDIDRCGSPRCHFFGTCRVEARIAPAISAAAPKCLWVDSLFLVQRVVFNALPIRVAVNEPHLWSVPRTSLGFSLPCWEMRASIVNYIVYTHPCTPIHPLLPGSGTERLDNGLFATSDSQMFIMMETEQSQPSPFQMQLTRGDC